MDTSSSEAIAEEASGYFSTVDTILLGAIVSIIVYFYFKSNSDDSRNVPSVNIHIE